MQFTTVRSKEKYYDIYLRSEKLVHSQQYEKKFPTKWKKCLTNTSYFEKEVDQKKNWFLAYFDWFLTNKNCCSYQDREKSGSLLFGDQKMQFTTVRSKKKDYYTYLKSKKLVHSQQEHDKNVSQLFGSGKNWFLAISSLTKTVTATWREKNVDPCIWRPKNIVQNCQEKEKDYDIYLKSEKLVQSQQEYEKNVSQLFGSGKN